MSRIRKPETTLAAVPNPRSERSSLPCQEHERTKEKDEDDHERNRIAPAPLGAGIHRARWPVSLEPAADDHPDGSEDGPQEGQEHHDANEADQGIGHAVHLSSSYPGRFALCPGPGSQLPPP